MAAEPKKVLIVDDEADARAFVQAVLEDEGYALLTAEDGQAGLEAVRRERPDLIILDVQMPRKDGFQVFHDLRRDAETKSIPVIMLTGVADRLGLGASAEAMGEYFGSEPEAYIEKPIAPEGLKETVRRLLSPAND